MIDGHQLLKVFLTKQSDEENYKSTLQWMKKSSFEQIEIELPAQLSVQLGMKNYYDVHYSKADSFAFEFNENEVFLHSALKMSHFNLNFKNDQNCTFDVGFLALKFKM